MKVGPTGRHFGQEVVEALEAREERMTREGLEKMGLCEEDADKRKVMLTAQLRSNTTMTKEWIVRRLRMDTQGS